MEHAFKTALIRFAALPAVAAVLLLLSGGAAIAFGIFALGFAAGALAIALALDSHYVGIEVEQISKDLQSRKESAPAPKPPLSFRGPSGR